jgi:hypothetical protein
MWQKNAFQPFMITIKSGFYAQKKAISEPATFPIVPFWPFFGDF